MEYVFYGIGRVFNFVGASNSQLRDGGCYFLAASVDDIHKFRTQFGKFSSSNISSMVCRFGQCFTQSCVSTCIFPFLNKSRLLVFCCFGFHSAISFTAICAV